MWYHLTLRVRIYVILCALILVTLTGGLIMIGYTFRMESLLRDIISKDFSAFETAAELEIALVNQKGFVSYYLQDRNPDWLKQLGECRQIFKERLNHARKLSDSPEGKTAIDQIETEYTTYITEKDRVIEYYRNGDHETGFRLHQSVRDRFFNILALCEAYKDIHRKQILQAKEQTQNEALHLRFLASVGIIMVFVLGLLLAFILVHHILSPLRELARLADRENSIKTENEIKSLSQTVLDLLEDVDQTHVELERSRESLLQAEKMAMVGKLAAGMAHSIRNPLTSIKMRLFSLSRSLKLNDTQKDDFDVISEEIRHVDTIVQNFLEFSRPPKLKMQRISPSAVVDMTLRLLEQRLKSYEVTVKVNRKVSIAEIQGDPEQLKEVLVNLIINACEAMENGGQIIIDEEVAIYPLNQAAIIRVSDDGPGIPETIIGKIFEPFYTTKEDGTGLGLSIVRRIIEQHRGKIDVRSSPGKGTTFIITLPIIGH